MTNRMPLITVIMNCYNCENFLRQAVESLLAQTYSNWELIFWDNQSTDNSAHIFKQYRDRRFHYHYAPRHTVLGEARRRAIEHAKGGWIGFLDCDDIWLPHKLRRQVDIIAEESQSGELGLVYTRTEFFDERGRQGPLIPRYHEKALPEGRIIDKLLTEEDFVPLVSTLILKKAYEELGEIPEDYQNAVDYYIFAGIAARYQVRAVQKVCCRYRVHSNNLSRNLHIVGCEEEIKTIEHWARFAPSSKKEIQCKIRRIKTAIGLSTIIRDKRLLKGIKYLWSHQLIPEVFWLVYDRYLIRNNQCFKLKVSNSERA